jgi:hypothetical protein
MAFYKEMESRDIRPDIVFVDGNHDYEFAWFDIARGARYLSRGGFIVVDNVAQPGPFFAACDFLAANPEWREHGQSTEVYDPRKAFDRARTTITNTDFMVLQAPPTHMVSARPWNIGRVRWRSSSVNGLRLTLAQSSGAGTLHVQVVLRGFGAVPAETQADACVELQSASGEINVQFDTPASLAGNFAYYTLEPWLIWRGNRNLQLADLPHPY